MLDAAALAEILDPERKVPGWWKKDQPNFGPPQPLDTLPWTFTGPPNLHTARKHAWRLEEWLEAQGYSYARESTHRRTQVTKRAYLTTVFEPRISPDMKDGMRKILAQDPNHTAALVAAVERISNEVR